MRAFLKFYLLFQIFERLEQIAKSKTNFQPPSLQINAIFDHILLYQQKYTFN